jgi:non-specific serine/threonine protein kinase
MLADFADGVWLVELAPMADPAEIVPALAGVLELRTAPGLPLVDLVTNHLRHKRMLIVLDNCEHLIDACARLADHLLRACPALKILASSREGLGIAGEVSYRVPSLSLPQPEASTMEALRRSEAGELFVDRAGAANAHFGLTPGNAAAVAQICHRLDGIPLALELAAARVRLFSAEQIATRIDDRFRLLTGGNRAALPRQQTLRAMIDWSYDLLAQPERALLRRLSVFAGGWAFEAADTVCADLDVLSLLDQLVNKSLVVAEESQGEVRYRMLETIRQYAREKLLEAGEGAALRDRHFDYFLQLSEEAEPALRGSALAWLDRLTRDYDNLAAAIEWGQAGRPEETLRLMGNLIFFWGFGVNGYQRSLRWLTGLLPKVEAPAGNEPASERKLGARARGLVTVGILNLEQGDLPAAISAFTDAIHLERALGEPFYLALALACLAALAFMAGDTAVGHPAAEEAAALMRSLNDKQWLVLSLPALAAFESRVGHEDKAAQLRQEANLYMDQANHPMLMPTFISLGRDARERHELNEAQMYFEKGLALARQRKSALYIAVMESELAHLAREQWQLTEAKTAYRRLIGIWKEFGHLSAVAHQLECFGFIAQAEHDPQRGARLLAAAEILRENIHIPMTVVEQVEYAAAVAELREQLGAGAFATDWAQGRTMDMERAIQYAVTPAGPSGAP